MESNDNKYFKWYWSICKRAKDRILENSIYVEKHHIYPKSIYGQNKVLVKLTAKEHYMVHLLLWQGLRFKYGTEDERTKKMAYAFVMMNVISPDHKHQRYNSNLYSFLRIAKKESNINYKHTKETILKMRIISLNRFKDKRNHPNFNRKMKESQKQKLIDRFVSEETRKKQSLSHKGKAISEETRKKQSLSHKGKKDSLETKKKKSDIQKKEVYQYDKNGIFIKEFNSVKDASMIVGANKSCISACCRNKRKTAGGYIWKYEKNINKQ